MQPTVRRGVIQRRTVVFERCLFLEPIVLQKSKVATQQIFRENTKPKTIADSGTLNRVAEVACGFERERVCPLTSLHESRAYSPQNF
jgi:hypothetical protein